MTEIDSDQCNPNGDHWAVHECSQTRPLHAGACSHSSFISSGVPGTVCCEVQVLEAKTRAESLFCAVPI